MGVASGEWLEVKEDMDEVEFSVSREHRAKSGGAEKTKTAAEEPTVADRVQRRLRSRG